MADVLFPYPMTLSTHALMDVANFFRGATPLPHAAHAAWELLGYGLSVGVPDAGEPVKASGPLPTGEEAAKLVEKFLPAEGGKSSAVALPWSLLIQMLWQVIQIFLQQHIPPIVVP